MPIGLDHYGEEWDGQFYPYIWDAAAAEDDDDDDDPPDFAD